MPTEPLIDPSTVDMGTTLFDREGVEKINPHRGEIVQVDSVVSIDLENMIIVGRRHVRDDEFWVPGHIPGRPLMPGVLMIEAVAQLTSILYTKYDEIHDNRLKDGFFGFGGVEKTRFRGTVVPGDDLLIVVKAKKIGRIGLFDGQIFKDLKLVMDCGILGAVV